MKYDLTFLVGCTGVLLFIACGQRDQMVREAPTDFCLNDALKQKIRIDTVMERPVTQHVNLTGEVTYNPDNVVQFVSLVEGIVVSTHFSLGDYVSKGQVLAAINSPELNAMLAERRNLNARSQVLERELAAAERLYADRIASARDLLEAQSEKERLAADLAGIESSLALFNPNERNGTFEILAPASGYIVEKNMSIGASFNDGESLFTISDLDEVWVMVNVYATDMQFVAPGMEARIRTLAYPNAIFNGQISALSQVFDGEERVLKARVIMKNKALELKPGMSADISVERRTEEQAVAIPADAVIFDDNQYFAVVYDGDCSLHVRNLTFSAKDDTWYFLAEGLAQGERVVSRNHLLVYEKIKNMAIN